MPKETYIPVKEAIDRAEVWAESGWLVHFKFTCEQCQTEVVFQEPNTIYEYGECFVCGHHTKVDKVGFLTMRMVK